MKATVAQLKKKVKALIQNTGTSLDTRNPYWMNKRHLEFMSEAVNEIVTDGNNSPDKRFTPTEAQIISLNNWIDDLESKYL